MRGTYAKGTEMYDSVLVTYTLLKILRELCASLRLCGYNTYPTSQ